MFIYDRNANDNHVLNGFNNPNPDESLPVPEPSRSTSRLSNWKKENDNYSKERNKINKLIIL